MPQKSQVGVSVSVSVRGYRVDSIGIKMQLGLAACEVQVKEMQVVFCYDWKIPLYKSRAGGCG